MHPVERYLAELRTVRTAGGVPETSGYPALKSLLDEIGSKLKPKVVCLVHPGNTGAGIPDMALFGKSQITRRTTEPKPGQLPEGGVVEVKSTSANLSQVLASEQVLGYVQRYGQVLVTNYRQFLLLVRDRDGGMRKVDEFSVAADESAFWEIAARPREFAGPQGDRVVEFLTRVLRNRALLAEPKDVAWFLASYARDALDRLEHQAEPPALHTIREAFEQALGLTFTGEQGDHFFRSSLVQTLFYGVFSGWVLWSQERSPTDRESWFDWKDAAWTLRVPMIRALFSQVAQPGQLRALGLVEVLDRAGDVLNRVDRAQFFQKFRTDEAVQYFYEPFLEAFDPVLRKELGVWYTPREIVQYQVARVDRVLREELGVADGLADPQVVVLDPCCGTGAYLVEVLKTIRQTLEAKGGDALLASDLRQAARDRVFGFELLPAPFVVAHLQLGLLMQQLGAPFGDDAERAGVFLTNALTGWEDQGALPHLPFAELEEERDRAQDVKRVKPILVILGNPPYNGFAGVTASEEERRLTDAYRQVKQAPKPQGQGLNDLYVRFFRMAERKIVEVTGRGVICVITNYSWLDGLSFTGMRERFLEVFDRIWIDCLNGDKYKTGKLTPDGDPDPSIFSTESSREGIQVGTAISLLVRKSDSSPPAANVGLTHHWGATKLQKLKELARTGAGGDYTPVEVAATRGFVLLQGAPSSAYDEWPQLPALFPKYFPGVQTKRDDFVVDIDEQRLRNRIEQYFAPEVSDTEIARAFPSAMKSTARFDGSGTRRKLVARGLRPQYFVRYLYRPFDNRYVYWEPETRLLGEKSPEYFAQVANQYFALAATQRSRRAFDPPFVSTLLTALHANEWSVSLFPLRWKGMSAEELDPSTLEWRINWSEGLAEYCRRRGEADNARVMMHALAIMHAPKYLSDAGEFLRLDWPRIPLSTSAELLVASSVLGTRLSNLLNPDSSAEGIEVHRGLGVLTSSLRVSLNPSQGDLGLTAGWGSSGRGGATMPGKGRITEREDGNLDIWLNDRAYWANVPRAVWEYTLGGYQVIKKWLSYREKALLGRDLTVEEARYVTEMIRRIAAIIALGPALDKNYERVIAEPCQWPPV